MKKICVIGVGAFGFSILHHLSKNNPKQNFYAYEKDAFVLSHLKNTKQSPYFFSGTTLSENVFFLDHLDDISTFDIIMMVIPAQFIGTFLSENSSKCKPGVTFLNLSKGIDIKNMQTPSDVIANIFPEGAYQYAVLSGGMIAEELVT